jgi:Dyp-type peroxidase family
MSALESEYPEIQGIMLFGYGDLLAARFCFLRVDDAGLARAWLSRATAEVRTAAPEHKNRPSALNLALTVAGLRALGVAEDVLATFPREMHQGMADPERSMILGDHGPSAPDDWEMGGPKTPPLHLLAMLYARDAAALETMAERLGVAGCAEGCTGAACGAAHQPARTRDGLTLTARIDSLKVDDNEHFGFRDGLAQPLIQGGPEPSARTASASLRDPRVAPGEFLLGHRNEYSQMTLSPSVATGQPGASALPPLFYAPEQRRDLGRNGSYLVLRKIQQHVGDFWKYLSEQATDELDAEALGARMVGRWPDGSPLLPGPRRVHDEFDFVGDDHGLLCPRGAHIRRANPRGALPPGPEESQNAVRRHRILRRGRPYGPPLRDARSGVDDRVERGLVFIGINANIVRQFEFVQQTWLNSVKFGRLHDEEDPLIGQREGGRSSFTIPADPVRTRITGMPRFVTIRGGGYFFLPSISALKFIARP